MPVPILLLVLSLSATLLLLSFFLPFPQVLLCKNKNQSRRRPRLLARDPAAHPPVARWRCRRRWRHGSGVDLDGAGVVEDGVGEADVVQEGRDDDLAVVGGRRHRHQAVVRMRAALLVEGREAVLLLVD